MDLIKIVDKENKSGDLNEIEVIYILYELIVLILFLFEYIKKCKLVE